MNRIFQTLFALGACSAVAGCATPKTGERLPPMTPDQTASIQKLIEGKLRDPASAQFRGLRALRAEQTLYVCGEVNARNGFGGYTGYVPFIVTSQNERGGRVTADLAREPTDAGLMAFFLTYPICR